MNVIAFVLYVVLAIVAVSLLPGIFVIVREIRRRRKAKKALERLELARHIIHELRHEPARLMARTLSRAFDRCTVEAALEEALDEEAVCADVCEKLGLRQAWEHSLRSARSWNERAHAAKMLGKLRARAASHSLVEALVDPDEDSTVRLAAGQAIGSIMDEAVVPHLCRALASYDERSAPTVAEALVSYGELAVGPVLDLLADKRPPARTWAARVLGRIGQPRATLRLISALADADATTRAAVAEALGRIGDVRAARALSAAALTDPAAPVRACASHALARTGDKEAAMAIVFALRDPDAEVRCRAADAIAALAPTDWSLLERALFDPYDRVRRSAALSLDRLGAVAAWTRALGSGVAEARIAAKVALEAVARAGLSDAITAAAANEGPIVRAIVEDLLNDVRLSAREPSPWVVSARRSARITSRLRALRELARAGTAEATAALAEVVVADPSPEARALAAAALSHCKERWLSAPALSRALMDPAVEVATEAARALGEAHGGDKRERRISDLPPNVEGSLRRTTGRITTGRVQARATLAG